jgi:ubiquinone/menaquinone biosynthesis C-methylase UbiE
MLTNILRTNYYFSDKKTQGPTNDSKDIRNTVVRSVTLYPYVKQMLSFNNMMWKGYIKAIELAALPKGSYGLDAGCGPGGILPLLASGINHKGKILGLDYTPEHVEYAREVKAKYLNKTYNRLDVEIGTSDFNQKPLQYVNEAGNLVEIEDNTFDWIWCCDTLCPGIFAEPQVVFKEFVRVTKPFGKIILFYGNDRTIMLPGYQRLENQLFEMGHFPDLNLSSGGNLLTQTEKAHVWMKMEGMHAIQWETFCVEKHGNVEERDVIELKGRQQNGTHEEPEYGDKIYLDYQLSNIYLDSLRDLHNGYDFPILDKCSPEYYPLQSDYYFRLTPQVNIGIVNK